MLKALNSIPGCWTTVEERIDLINNLKRKYGNTIKEILAFGEHAQAQLDSITHAEERMEELAAPRGTNF